jgi:hypothetical protein
MFFDSHSKLTNNYLKWSEPAIKYQAQFSKKYDAYHHFIKLTVNSANYQSLRIQTVVRTSYGEMLAGEGEAC